MTVREQLFTFLRNLRWIAVFSVVISILLYLPDQIQELYRIAADDIGWVTLNDERGYQKYQDKVCVRAPAGAVDQGPFAGSCARATISKELCGIFPGRAGQGLAAGMGPP
ncbi:hypothetical protein [Bradyrhizobium sp. Ghvi]|uniref:hypothetical protein n=1 Tax=Bradyrhizobium sp. Ghvi TaxID=1855319 RepID=UPI0015A72E03|nr:hypothetical protein [Bradyrhizobium sp. Ghvi]